MSSSSAKTSSSQQQTTETENLNLQSTSGVTVVGSSGVTLTDQGAIKAGVDIGKSAINLGQSGIDAGIAVGTAGLDAARAAYSGSLSLVGDVTSQAIDAANRSGDRVARFATDAIDENSDLAKTLNATSVNAVVDAGQGVLDFARTLFTSALSANNQVVSQDIAGVNTLAAQVSQSSQQSINDAVVKLVTIVAIAGAAVLIFKGAK